MMQHQISLNKWIAARILHDVALHDVAVGGAAQLYEIPAALGPLARRRRAYHRQAATDRSALEGGLGDAKISLHVLPFQAIEGISLGSVRAIGRERSIAHLTIGRSEERR